MIYNIDRKYVSATNNGVNCDDLNRCLSAVVTLKMDGPHSSVWIWHIFAIYKPTDMSA